MSLLAEIQEQVSAFKAQTRDERGRVTTYVRRITLHAHEFDALLEELVALKRVRRRPAQRLGILVVRDIELHREIDQLGRPNESAQQADTEQGGG